MARADKRLRPARPAVRKGHRLPTDETGAFPQDEESYRRLVELSPDAIAVHAEGRLVYANPAAAELIGAASPEELIGMPILDIVHPAFHGIVLERTRQEVEEGRAVPLLEEKFVRLDGAVVDVEVAGIPITFRGKRAGQVMVRDITERKRAEREIREADTRYRTLAEQLPAVVYIRSPEGPNSTVYISPQIQQMVGYSPDEWLADHDLWGRLLHPDDRDRAIAASLEAHTTGQPYRGEYRLLTRAGQYRWVLDEAMVLRDEAGKPTFSQGVLLDITDLKEAEEARRRTAEELRAAEAKYRALVENIPAVFFVDLVDDDMTTLYVSPQIETVLGLNPQEYTAAPGVWVQHLHPEDREQAMHTYRREREKGEPFSYEYRMLRPDGGTVWISETVTVLRDERGERIVQGVMFDITERKQTEREILKQNELLASLHETALGLMNRLDLEDLLEAIVARAAPLLGTPHGYLYVANGGEEELVCRVGTGVFRSFLGFKLKPGEGIGGMVWRTGQPLSVNDYDSWEGRAKAFPMGVCRAVTGVPLKSGSRVMGVLGMAHVTEDRRFGEEDLRTLERFAELASMALDNAQLYATSQAELQERKAAEQALRFQTQLLGTVQDAVIATDSRGCVTYVNDFAEKLYGWSREEVLAKHILDVVTPADSSKDLFGAGDALGGTPWSGEFDLLRRDGSPFTAWVMVSPLRDGDGVVAGTIGVTIDITERKLAEEAYRESERRYREMLQTIQLLAVGLDRVGRITFCNDFLLDLTGWRRDEILGQSWFDRLTPEDERESLREVFAAELAQETISPGRESHILTRWGRRRLVSWSNTSVRDPTGRVTEVSSIGADITERAETEQALLAAFEREREMTHKLRALDEMKNTFLHAVSHELRTPLAAVLGFALTLERDDIELTPDETREMTHRLAVNARKLDQLLSDLLDLDRLDRGIVEPRSTPTDVGSLVHRVLGASDIRRERPVDAHTESVVVAVDASKVERIVENLLANAARHTPPGGRVWVRARREGSGALIVVEDEGPGIPEEFRESIFEPFGQGPPPMTHASGMGVGLSLVAKFADLHGGRAWVEPREGGGSSFRVWLPGYPFSTGTPTRDPYSVQEPS